MCFLIFQVLESASTGVTLLDMQMASSVSLCLHVVIPLHAYGPYKNTSHAGLDALTQPEFTFLGAESLTTTADWGGTLPT